MTFHTEPRTSATDDAQGALDENLRAHLGDEYDRTYAVAGESARYVSESDVENPDQSIIWGYGSDHRVRIPARDEN